jgi:alkylhydroperoxidase/carboxymuconolactone decarboxylase family protein YurZ
MKGGRFEMTAETREEKVHRLISEMHRDRALTPESVTEHYNYYDFAVELDPEYFEARPTWGGLSGWGFFKDKPRHLDPMIRQVIACVLLAFRNTPGCYHHMKKAIDLGATYEQILEAYNVAAIPAGGPTRMVGLKTLKRIADERAKSGVKKKTPAPIPEKNEKEDSQMASLTREERFRRMIEKYNPEGGVVNEALAFGMRLDPEYFEGYCQGRWGFYDDVPRYWKPVEREMFMLVLMAFKGMKEELYMHTKKALRLGATMEQLLEAFETGVFPGGSQVLIEGLLALKRIHDETLPTRKEK